MFQRYWERKSGPVTKAVVRKRGALCCFEPESRTWSSQPLQWWVTTFISRSEQAELYLKWLSSEICWLSIFKRAQLEVQAYYAALLIRAMVWNTIALWWHCYGITVNDQNIKELIEVQSSIKVNWFFWQRMQMCFFDSAWIPTTQAWLTLVSMVINLWTAGWDMVKGRGK